MAGGFARVDGTWGDRPVSVLMISSVPRPGVAMFLSLFSALAVGLVLIVAVLTVVLPFILGFFDRRDTP